MSYDDIAMRVKHSPVILPESNIRPSPIEWIVYINQGGIKYLQARSEGIPHNEAMKLLEEGKDYRRQIVEYQVPKLEDLTGHRYSYSYHKKTRGSLPKEHGKVKTSK